MIAALIFIFFYKYIHPPNDISQYTENVFLTLDVDDYSTIFTFNPLFSLAYQKLFQNSYGYLTGAIFGQIISGLLIQIKI